MLDCVEFNSSVLDMLGGQVQLKLWPYGNDLILVLIVAESDAFGKIHALPHPAIGPNECSFEELLEGLTFLDEAWLSTTVEKVNMHSGTIFGPHVMAKAVFNLLLEGGWIESDLPFFTGDEVLEAEQAIANKAFASFGTDMSEVLEKMYEGRPFEFHLWPIEGEDGLYGYAIKVLSGQCQSWELEQIELTGPNKVLAILQSPNGGGSIVETTFGGQDLNDVLSQIADYSEINERFVEVTRKIGMVLGPIYGHTMAISHLSPTSKGPNELMPMVEIRGLFALEDASVLLINDASDNLERYHHRYFGDKVE